MGDPYAALGVAPTATQDEITRAYRRQLRTHHPDMRSETGSAADERLREILAAYALLRDPLLRAQYDRAADPGGASAQKGPRAVRVTVTRVRPAPDRPPLWAGPVRWHRS